MRWDDETRLAAEHLGWEVVETDGVSDYQGWGVHLLRRGGEWGVLAWDYGSCSGCDSYEGTIPWESWSDPAACADVFGGLVETCESEERARDLFSARKGW